MKTTELPLQLCAEYDSAAHWCACRGLKGAIGDPLPEAMDPNGAYRYIKADPEAFEQRVRQFAYALAMERTQRRLSTAGYIAGASVGANIANPGKF